MANIKKLKANGQDIVPITHEQAVLDSNGVTLESKLATINNAISQLQNNSTSGTPSNPSLGGNTTIITMGNYIITYNETDDTLDFIYNGETGGDTPEEPLPNTYVTDGLSIYIDASDVTTQGSVRDFTGKQNIVNHGVSTTLDNGCLNFVASESNYIDCGFKPNLTQWSAEFYLYFDIVDTATLLGWGASGNRTAIAYWGNGFMIAINDDTQHTIMSTLPTSLTHLVLTYNNGDIIAYVNGEKSQITTNANVMTSQASNLTLGAKYSVSEFSDMHLKSFRFYDGKTLTDTEALQNYNYEKNRN